MQFDRSKYEYHRVTDPLRNNLFFKRVSEGQADSAESAKLLLRVASSVPLQQEYVRDVFRKLGKIRYVKGCSYKSKQHKKIYYFNVKFKDQDQLLKAFDIRFFQGLLRPVLPLVPQVEEHQLQDQGFVTVRKNDKTLAQVARDAQVRVSELKLKRAKKEQKALQKQGLYEAVLKG